MKPAETQGGGEKMVALTFASAISKGKANVTTTPITKTFNPSGKPKGVVIGARSEGSLFRSTSI